MVNYDGIPISKIDIQNVDKKIQHYLALFTVMLYIKGNKGKEGIGTAVFIEFRKKKYLITAAHVFEDFKKDKNFLNTIYIDRFNKSLAYGFSPAICFSQKPDNYFDEPDIAIFGVSDQVSIDMKNAGILPFEIKEYFYHNQFLMFHNFIFGYPASFNIAKKSRFSKNHNKTKYYCLDLPFNFDCEKIPNFCPVKNIALHFSPKILELSEEYGSGKKVVAPPLNGMSGCGIWAIPSYPLLNFEDIFYLGMFTSISPEYKSAIGFSTVEIINSILDAENSIFPILRR